MSRTFDVFQVCHPFRDNVREFQILMRPLADLEPVHLIDAEGFWHPGLDTAIVSMRFDPVATSRVGESMLLTLAGRSGLPMVVPSRLSPAQRSAFFMDHLSRYSTYVQQYHEPRESSSMLERVLGCLAAHIADEPRRSTRIFDVHELPLINPRRRRRMASAAIV
jgi:hypothetical protein